MTKVNDIMLPKGPNEDRPVNYFGKGRGGSGLAYISCLLDSVRSRAGEAVSPTPYSSCYEVHEVN